MPGRIDDVSEASTRAARRVGLGTAPAGERLADYNRLTDVALRSKHEPEKGLDIAERSTMIRRARAPRSADETPLTGDDAKADGVGGAGYWRRHLKSGTCH